MAELFHNQDRRNVESIAGVWFETADPSLAKNDMGLPLASMYSADIGNSSIVDIVPRLSMFLQDISD